MKDRAIKTTDIINTEELQMKFNEFLRAAARAHNDDSPVSKKIKENIQSLEETLDKANKQ